VTETSGRELDSLIDQLQTLRRKLQADGSRIQHDITEYAELNQQVIQVTAIIGDSVKKLPVAASAAIAMPAERTR
jgi:hypothetical protein